MTERTTFGIRLPNSGPFASPAMIQEIAGQAEALGFDAVWVNDHIAWTSAHSAHFSAGSVEAVREGPPHFYESLATVSFVAGRTRRIKVGIAGLMLPLRDPRVLAKQMGTLHLLSGGRLIPALAIGRFEDEFVAQQVAYRRRGRITDEYLECLAAIFGPARVTTFDGAHVQITGAEYFPKPDGLPLWICGLSPQAFRRVVRFGAGWLPSAGPVEEYGENWRALSALLVEAGRSPDALERGIEIFTCIACTDEAAREAAAASLRHQSGDVERGAAKSLIGSPATITARMRRYIAAGVTHFELKFISHTSAIMLDMMRRYAGEVVPALR